MHPKNFELVPHTADLQLRAYGSTREELFCNALIGMFTVIKPHGPHISYEKTDDPEPKLVCRKFTSEQAVHIKSQNLEQLLVDFLSECLYLSDTHNTAYFDAKFSLLEDTELAAVIYGTEITKFEVVEIKAVTYHELDIEEIDGTWQATLVFDI